MQSRLKNIKEFLEYYNRICLSCSNMLLKGRVAAMIDIEDSGGGMSMVPCVSYQCRVFYEKMGAHKELVHLQEVMNKLNLNC